MMDRTDVPEGSGRLIVVRGKGVSRRVFLRASAGVGAAVGLGGLPAFGFAGQGLTKVPVAQTANSLFYLMLYTAVEQGLFKEEGIEVEVITAGGSAEAVNAVVARQAACSTQDPVRCEAARQKGASTKLIGASIDRFATYIVGKKDIAPQNVETWKGRKIAAIQRPNTAYSIIEYVLQKAGWKEERPNNWVSPKGGPPVELLEVKMGNEFQALLAGVVDMACGYEPAASDAMLRGKDLHLIWSFAEYFGEFLYAGWCAHEEDIQKRPERLQAFLNGMAHAYKFIREEKEKTIAVGKKWFPRLDPRAIEAAFLRFVKEGVYPQRNMISKRSWDANFQDFLPFVKYPLNLPVKMEDATYLEFAKKADAKYGLGA